VYRVEIATGNRRGAGTSATVFVQLRGSQGSTPRYVIPGPFLRDTVVQVDIHSETDLGIINAINVGHDNAGGLGVGWYLDAVSLDYGNGEDQISIAFPVRRWLGKSDVGYGTFPTSVSLKAGIMDSMTDPEDLSTRLNYETLPRKPLFVETGVAAFPSPSKVRSGERAIVRLDSGQAGEDAYTIAAVEHPDLSALEVLPNIPLDALDNSPYPTTVSIAVADGVYSWRAKGIDAGEWSRYLAMTIRHQLQHHVKSLESEEEEIEDDLSGESQNRSWADKFKELALEVPVLPLRHPLEVLELAERNIRGTAIQGSSTACIASIHGLNRKMFVACLGDSGVMIYRPSLGIIFRTPEQEHQFGYPFQLGHHEHSDRASDAMVFDWSMMEGDVVIVASDGLFDNVNESEIAAIVDKYAKTDKSEVSKSTKHLAGQCARELASVAYKYSIGDEDTPFSSTAAEEFDLVWHGGKKDDITVVVALLS